MIKIETSVSERVYIQVTVWLTWGSIDIVIFPKIKHFDSYKDVRDHIIAMDDKLCTETFLINLITYCPNRDDDLVTMQKFLEGPEENCAQLDLTEQFTIEVKPH